MIYTYNTYIHKNCKKKLPFQRPWRCHTVLIWRIFLNRKRKRKIYLNEHKEKNNNILSTEWERQKILCTWPNANVKCPALSQRNANNTLCADSWHWIQLGNEPAKNQSWINTQTRSFMTFFHCCVNWQLCGWSSFQPFNELIIKFFISVDIFIHILWLIIYCICFRNFNILIILWSENTFKKNNRFVFCVVDERRFFDLIFKITDNILISTAKKHIFYFTAITYFLWIVNVNYSLLNNN